jgi:hypothetical protein
MLPVSFSILRALQGGFGWGDFFYDAIAYKDVPVLYDLPGFHIQNGCMKYSQVIALCFSTPGEDTYRKEKRNHVLILFFLLQKC